MTFAELEIGTNEKHQLRYEKDCLSGADKLFADGQLVKSRKWAPLTFKLPATEVGNAEKHKVVMHFGFKEMMRMRPIFEIDGKKYLPTADNSIPEGSWIFLIGSLLMVAGGGAIPALIGVGGAAACVHVLRDKKRSPGMQKVICGAIVLGAWAVLFLVVGILPLPK